MWGGVSRQWCGVGWGKQTVVWGGVGWGKQTVVYGGVIRQLCGVGVSRQWCGVGWGKQTVVWGGVICGLGVLQVAHLDSQEESVILGRGYVTFLPLRGEKIDQDAARRQALTVDRLRTKAWERVWRGRGVVREEGGGELEVWREMVCMCICVCLGGGGVRGEWERGRDWWGWGAGEGRRREV